VAPLANGDIGERGGTAQAGLLGLAGYPKAGPLADLNQTAADPPAIDAKRSHAKQHFHNSTKSLELLR
jgi:hypothetical protein